MAREKQIMKRLEAGDRDVPTLVANCYPGLDPRLVPAAGVTVTAHLMELARRGLVERGEEDQWQPKPHAAD
jgi:hypothetical protein